MTILEEYEELGLLIDAAEMYIDSYDILDRPVSVLHQEFIHVYHHNVSYVKFRSLICELANVTTKQLNVDGVRNTVFIEKGVQYER